MSGKFSGSEEATPGTTPCIPIRAELEGDPPWINVDSPDSTVDFPGLETWTPKEARLIGGFMVAAAGLLDIMA